MLAKYLSDWSVFANADGITIRSRVGAEFGGIVQALDATPQPIVPETFGLERWKTHGEVRENTSGIVF